MAWVYLLLAGLFEIAWATALKSSDGFTRLWPSLGTGAALLVSLVFFGLALRELPLGPAYAVWTGVGAAGTVLAGVVLFGEPTQLGRLLCVALIVGGILGLKLAS